MSSSSISLTATAAFGGINVRWTYPSVNGHAVAHTLLYRGESSNFAASIQRAVASGNSFYDQVNTDTLYYYWIRVVSVNGTVGDLIGPASARARLRSDDTIEDLTGRISDGVLATSLRATLDNISMINANLNAEIFDRETGETSFAAALLDVQNGVAAAHSFITTEINSRVTANSAIAEQINLVAVTLGDQVAAVVISADAWIGPHASLSGKVTDIGALWTAKVTVNGLIGGFGIYNDGTTVEAGFDVDTFWIGRTGTDKVLPFIIDSGTVYINKARIKDADIDTLKIKGHSVTVPFFGGFPAMVYGSRVATDWQWLPKDTLLMGTITYTNEHAGFHAANVTFGITHISDGDIASTFSGYAYQNYGNGVAAASHVILYDGWYQVFAIPGGEAGGICTGLAITALGGKR